MELDVFHLFIWEPILFEGTAFEVNRVVLLMYLGALLCLLLFVSGARRASVRPSKFALAVESGYTLIRDKVAIDIMGPEGVRYAPFLATLFWFIFFTNILGITPGVNMPATSRMAIPAALALLSWVVFNFVGFKRHGFGYLKDTLFPPGVPKPIYILLTPIEAASVFIIRPLTLALRLFANMMAGHVLLTVFFLFTQDLLVHGSLFQRPLGVLTFFTATALILFELLVVIIQSYIFTALTAFYIAEAMHGHGEEELLEAEPEREVEGVPEEALARA